MRELSESKLKKILDDIPVSLSEVKLRNPEEAFSKLNVEAMRDLLDFSRRFYAEISFYITNSEIHKSLSELKCEDKHVNLVIIREFLETLKNYKGKEVEFPILVKDTLARFALIPYMPTYSDVYAEQRNF